jgi:plastocyanin
VNTLFIILAIPAIAFAHAGEEHDIDLDIVRRIPQHVPLLARPISTCLTIDSQEGRNNCYASLCDPGYDCAQSLIMHATIQGEGPTEGIKVLHDVISESPRFGLNTDGHELGHVIGRTHMKIHGLGGEKLIECPPDFLYACQHGYFEQAMADKPDDPLDDIAISICETIAKEPIGRNKFYCYHGVGHGIMMARQNDIYETLRVCDRLPYENASRGCWQGAFMENINAVQTGVAREGVFDEADPLAPCNIIPLKYQWNCYESQAARMLMVTKNDFQPAVASCKKAHPVSRPSCSLSLAQFTTNPGWQKMITDWNPEFLDGDKKWEFSMQTAVDLCESFPKEDIETCYIFAIGNAMNYDDTNNAVEFCSLTPPDFHRLCFQKISNELHYHGLAQEEIDRICREYFPDEWIELCSKIDEEGQTPIVRGSMAEDINKPSILQKTISIILWPVRILFGSGDNARLWDDPPEELPFLDNSIPTIALPLTEENVISNGVISDVLIRFTGDEFEPNEISISAGGTVTWTNDTDEYFWPASNVHPTHDILPEFDAKKPLSSSRSFSFTFIKKGTWEFHDHLHPNAIGKVIVK